jgi:integral membrane protein (TIGR01906 family)
MIPRWLPTLLVLVITLAVPVILILSNVLLFMNPAWLAFQYSQPGFPQAELFSDKDRLYFGSESIEYVRGNRTLEQFRALGVYQEREIKHMIDVRMLVDQVKIVLPVVALLAIIAFIVLARHPNTRALAPRALLNGALLTIGLFVVIGLFAAVGFNTFFTLFHRIFFEGDTWLFNYTDSLIQFYPLPFWFATSIALIGLTVLEAIVVGVIGWWGRTGGGRP